MKTTITMTMVRSPESTSSTLTMPTAFRQSRTHACGIITHGGLLCEGFFHASGGTHEWRTHVRRTHIKSVLAVPGTAPHPDGR
eukprot:1389659-Rhodomonas_salina.1